MKPPKYYYTTRDLLMMAALAALGGIASTYINFIGDFFQSFLGFAGTTQWAAGLHVLWLVLAVGLTKKQGAGTFTGILKGAVELFSGNTHGLLVLLVGLIAGILVDLAVLPFRRKHQWLVYAVAGGIASASNVFVFQLFAALPADVLTYGVIGLIALVAFFSGVIFAGILGSALLAALRRAGAVKNQPAQPLRGPAMAAFWLGAITLAGGLFGYLKITRGGTGAVAISGAVSQALDFTSAQSPVAEQVFEIEQNGVVSSYRGYSLEALITYAEPDPDFDSILITATDGYSFLISAAELSENPNIALQAKGSGKSHTYSIIGPESKKAWVNGVVEILVIKSSPLSVVIEGKENPFHALDWIHEMDSTTLDVGFVSKKYQGVPLSSVLAPAANLSDRTEVVVSGMDGNQHILSLDAVREDAGIRIFIVLDRGTITYALAHLDGEVFVSQIDWIMIP